MPRIIPADGANPCRLFICGERPGIEEYSAWRGLVGPAGQEWWERLWRICRIERDVCWVTNLVKTFSTAPPTFKEIARDAPLLRQELREVESADDGPLVIVTVGYHAARWFLPQFQGVNGDFFHGLAFTTPRRKNAIVIPCCHSAAALRQPERYQNQLTEDLRAVGQVLSADAVDLSGLHGRIRRSAAPRVFSCGLADILYYGGPLAVDSEGANPRKTECFTVANRLTDACCVETWQHKRKTPAFPHVQAAIDQAPSLISHHAKVEMAALDAMGLSYKRVDCTMLEAYELGLPQSLKVLAYRLCGYEMREYLDLVTPLDDSIVKSVLEAAHGQWHRQFFEHVEAWQAATERYRASRKRAGQAPRTPRADPAVAPRPACERPGKKPAIPAAIEVGGVTVARRALASIKGILEKQAESSRRDRWENSKFAPLLTLPPVPTWKDVPRAERRAYALTDAVAHLAVHQEMRPMLAKAGVERIYAIDRSILPFLVRNEQVGLRVDERELSRLDRRFTREYADVLTKLEALAGHPVNPLASEEVSETIFDEWEVQPTRMNKSGYYTTEDKYLKARKHQHEGIPLVIEGRQINKMHSTYVKRLPALLRRGRYHPNWKYTRTASGRAAEEIILLIPKHSARGQAIRRAFSADDDCILLSCDLSQIEMRVMAHESRDAKFLYNYEHGIDMHANTAHELLGAPRDKDQQDESLHRLPAKTLNFGVLMGMTEYGLADQLQERGLKWQVNELDRAIAADRELLKQGFKSTREFLREWFKVYPGVAEWVRQRKAEARKTGYVRDLYDRRIAVSGVWSADDRIKAEWERKAHAIPIQSGAQGTVKKWIALVWKHIIAPRIRDGRRHCEPWVWIHDDVTLCVDERIPRTVAREMLAMVPQDLCVPVSADAKAGRNWASYDKKHPQTNPEGLGSLKLAA